jgi:hypothetical protein
LHRGGFDAMRLSANNKNERISSAPCFASLRPDEAALNHLA